MAGDNGWAGETNRKGHENNDMPAPEGIPGSSSTRSGHCITHGRRQMNRVQSTVRLAKGCVAGAICETRAMDRTRLSRARPCDGQYWALFLLLEYPNTRCVVTSSLGGKCWSETF